MSTMTSRERVQAAVRHEPVDRLPCHESFWDDTLLAWQNQGYPADADPGTIRADFAASIEENVVHGSDGPDTAATEITFFFGDDGVCPRTR